MTDMSIPIAHKVLAEAIDGALVTEPFTTPTGRAFAEAQNAHLETLRAILTAASTAPTADYQSTLRAIVGVALRNLGAV